MVPHFSTACMATRCNSFEVGWHFKANTALPTAVMNFNKVGGDISLLLRTTVIISGLQLSENRNGSGRGLVWLSFTNTNNFFLILLYLDFLGWRT